MRPYRNYLACIAAMLFAGVAIAQSTALIPQAALLTYLDQLTQWQRNAVALEPTATNAREVVFRDSLRENASKTLQSGFVFIRSVARTETTQEAVDPASTRQRLTERAAASQQRITALQQQLARLSVKSKAYSATNDQLRLEQARHELTRTILANLNAASNKAPDKLAYTLDSLTRSIPEIASGAPPVTADAAEPTVAKRPATSILGLSASAFEITRKQRELDEVIANTTEFKKQSMELMKALRSGLGEPSEEAEEKASADDAPKPRPLSIDERVEAYKQIGANIVPLAETMRWIDASKQTMKEWREVLQQRRDEVLRQLGIRTGLLVITLGLALGVSELVRHMLARIPDSKRKRQLNSARRVATGVAVLVVLLLNFISDFSSFATFAGFLTAGLAVALQSVLLSLVAHFLFYGRYGIRNGDRVHVAGVTGDIVQIGMIRFYLRELAETENGLEPTGKIVAFPNSIVFQNLAFYKYS